jgi:Ca-activated chloride channel family protein
LWILTISLKKLHGYFFHDKERCAVRLLKQVRKKPLNLKKEPAMKLSRNLMIFTLPLALAACQQGTMTLTDSIHQKEESISHPVVVTSSPAPQELKRLQERTLSADIAAPAGLMMAPAKNENYTMSQTRTWPQWNTESYTYTEEKGFHAVHNDPLSTFSIDVDTASYSNLRRFVQQGSLPPVGAIRIEEMLNYFSYDYPQPDKGPFSVTTEVGPCLWQPDHQLVRIGLKGKMLDKGNVPPSNLVFLVDVSGSMQDTNKLPLLKKSMKMLVAQLNGQDRVAIVVYAGCDRIALPPTSGADKKTINDAIDNLAAGGSTNGASGIVTAYDLAGRVYMPAGNNRIILASDGDFNVGVTSRGELQKLVEEKKKSGIYLTVLGFGMGNYHDDTMEVLADKGNGNYAYIDNLMEAKKVLVKEMTGTMFAIAKDVKIQVEFNPAQVAAYRLVGYENRLLADEDFNNDLKDAGEIGAGHTVTALYELIMTGIGPIPAINPLKYQRPSVANITAPGEYDEELLTVKVRYKEPREETSKLLNVAVNKSSKGQPATSADFQFASAVAGFGMVLTDSAHKQNLSYKTIIASAKNGKGTDNNGYRAEFIRLVENSELLSR